ncbi:MAG: hypothetical protein ACERKO_05420 [Acetanaerobacterium sp.]
MRTALKQAFKLLFLFTAGGVAYLCVELLFRGYTHWTMFIVGGFCFVLIGAINEFMSFTMALTSQMLISAVIITAVEYITGSVVNVWLGWDVWDYANMPYNLHGQICLLYFCLWFGLSLAAILLDDILRYRLFGEERPHYKIL